MSSRKNPMVPSLIAFSVALVMAFGAVSSAAAADAREIPLLVDLGGGVSVQVVNVHFTDEIPGSRGNHMKVPEDKTEVMRLAVVTIKITKPAGTKVNLAAADVTLHYYHGDEVEVAPCEGLSPFTTTDDQDRAMELSLTQGPGFLKQSTGPKAEQATTVYFDAAFGYMEPDTAEVWVCIGQPGSSQKPFVTKGWRQ